MNHNCPFYGRHMTDGRHMTENRFLLIDQNGNQCAIVKDAYAPCFMEIEGNTPDWKTCPRLADILVTLEGKPK